MASFLVGVTLVMFASLAHASILDPSDTAMKYMMRDPESDYEVKLLKGIMEGMGVKDFSAGCEDYGKEVASHVNASIKKMMTGGYVDIMEALEEIKTYMDEHGPELYVKCSAEVAQLTPVVEQVTSYGDWTMVLQHIVTNYGANSDQIMLLIQQASTNPNPEEAGKNMGAALKLMLVGKKQGDEETVPMLFV